MPELLELAARVEAAEGADRELDRALYSLLYPPLPPAETEDQPPPGFGCGGFLSDQFWGFHFTASIDAAMTLVPEGWQGDGLNWWTGCNSICTLVESRLVNGEWVRDKRAMGRVEGIAATPALALCAASLRARAADHA